MSPSTTATRSGSARDNVTVVTGPGMNMGSVGRHWIIKHFGVIMAEPKSLISRQKIQVPLEIGDDCPTMWSVYLSYDESDESVRINFELEKYPEGRTIFAKMKLTIIFKNVFHSCVFNRPCCKMSIGSWAFGWTIIKNGKWTNGLLGKDKFEGTVRCLISLKAYANSVDNNAQKNIPQFTADTTNRKRMKKIDAASQLLLDIAKIYKSGGSKDVLSDFKMVTNDGKEFYVHKAILAARSTVFHAMFHSTVTENQTGVLKLNDVSSTALNIVLHYVYTGEFHPDTSKLSPNGYIAAGIVSASDKYQLPILRDYLKEVFGDKCPNSNLNKSGKGLAKSKDKSNKKKKSGFLSQGTHRQQKRCCLQ